MRKGTKVRSNKIRSGVLPHSFPDKLVFTSNNEGNTFMISEDDFIIFEAPEEIKATIKELLKERIL